MTSIKDASISEQVAKDWVNGPYYDDAEQAMDGQWKDLIWPIIQDCDFRVTVDLAAGHGRNTERLRHLATKVIAVDVNDTNITFLKRRFASEEAANVEFLLTDGITLAGIADDSVTMLYCFDAMVHFDSDVVRSYIQEAARVLAPRGRGFIHYSNNTSNPTGTYRDHPGWRNFMSRALFEHWLTKEGLGVIRSNYILHNQEIVSADVPNADCISLFEKP